MTIEAEIVEALRTSHGTHEAILAEVAKARAQNEALKLKIVELEAIVARLEAQNVNVVDPAEVKPLLDELGRVLTEGYGIALPEEEAVAPSGAPNGAPAPDAHPVRSSARGWA